MHHDGCGMAFSNNGSLEIHKRSKENTWDESYRQIAKTASSNIFIAHNRLASKGLEMNEEGAHPFSVTALGKTFSLCHNGGIRTYMDEAIDKHTSDTFIFLQKLIDISGKNEASDILQRLRAISDETDYSSLCSFLITDSELFVWRIYNEKEQGKKDEYEKYYTLYMSMRNNSVLFSSEALDDSPWMLMENKTFLHLHFSGSKISVEYCKI